MAIGIASACRNSKLGQPYFDRTWPNGWSVERADERQSVRLHKARVG